MRGVFPQPKKRIRKQKHYDSGSDESDEPRQERLPSSDHINSTNPKEDHDISNAVGSAISLQSDGSKSYGSEDVSEDDGGVWSTEEEDEQAEAGAITPQQKKTSKRNDPDAFATSISKILSTKLSQTARQDPVLSRSREAAAVSKNIADQRLERRAQAKLRAERKEEMERGRVKDVLGLESGTAGQVAEEEKQLRKVAQRGVVKLFNAVRVAQVRGEQAAREARSDGIVGHAQREEKVNEMSKQGFLELINGGKNGGQIQEAR